MSPPRISLGGSIIGTLRAKHPVNGPTTVVVSRWESNPSTSFYPFTSWTTPTDSGFYKIINPGTSWILVAKQPMVGDAKTGTTTRSGTRNEGLCHSAGFVFVASQALCCI